MQTAYKFNIENHSIDKATIPIPIPKSNELILKVLGSGICHSDCVTRDGILRIPRDNFVGGHEISGEIFRIGNDLKQDFKVGDRYCVHSNNPCGKCFRCQIGAKNICVNSFENGFGLGNDGGWQQYLLISNPDTLVKIPSNVTFFQAAVVTDSLLTPYHAIKKANLNISDKILIIGAGGLGMNLIQLVKLYNCSAIVVVDKKTLLKDQCLKLGATDFYSDLRSTDKFTKDDFDCVIDVVGLSQTYAVATHYCRPKGKIIAIGLGKGKIEFNLSKLCNKEITMMGNYYGTVEELKECLELVDRKLILPKIVELKFDNINGIVNDLHDGKIKGRAVFNPNENMIKL